MLLAKCNERRAAAIRRKRILEAQRPALHSGDERLQFRERHLVVFRQRPGTGVRRARAWGCGFRHGRGVKFQNKSDILRQKRIFRPADLASRGLAAARHVCNSHDARPYSGKNLTQISHLPHPKNVDPGIIAGSPKSNFRWLGCSLLSRFHREWECPI
ncbi:exodeoxyribonuclease 7 small subunit domain protein [Burkholderia pseudomallei TSV32]|nr:exodeoxyribonuclease 7 small subunit domain protein [Burkholderia pseudomallei TSV32]